MDDEDFCWLCDELESAHEVYGENFALREENERLKRENERMRAIVESRPAGCWADDAR